MSLKNLLQLFVIANKESIARNILIPSNNF